MEAIRFLNDFSRLVHELRNELPASEIDNFIYNQFKHFLNKLEVPEEQTHCSYRTVAEILLDRTENVTFDADTLHEMVVKLPVLVKNPYLGYALYESLQSVKVILPKSEEHPNLYLILNMALAKFKSDEIIDQFRIKLYNDVKVSDQFKLNSQVNKSEEKRLSKRISLIDKKICLLSSK